MGNASSSHFITKAAPVHRLQQAQQQQGDVPAISVSMVASPTAHVPDVVACVLCRFASWTS